jgi:hypothetical protein
MSVLVRGRCHSELQMMALLRPACRGRRSYLRPDGPPGGQLCVPTRWHASAGRCGARGGGAHGSCPGSSMSDAWQLLL